MPGSRSGPNIKIGETRVTEMQIPGHLFALLTAVLLAVCGSTDASAANVPEEHHHHVPGDALQLDAGKRWSTDAPLRQAMAAINAALAEKLHAAHANSLDKDQYRALADILDEQMNFMVRNCELGPAADAELHKLLGMLGEASGQMKTPEEGRQGFIKAVRTMQLYGEYFEHAGWQSPTH